MFTYINVLVAVKAMASTAGTKKKYSFSAITAPTIFIKMLEHEAS